ncbi:NADPH_oxidoreductase [Hexamita inflata]|uniref:NADPH oxidoreductase n=1 Tax=Hexamita inflata TaxID=28002 RepID=A0AA86UUP0_9EUKA|nr:NADPH oxidoreductase [Hexamita inflata]
MKTLVIVFHPNYSESVRNKLLVTELSKNDNVTLRIIQSPFDVQTEKEILSQFQRVVFQYPVYWWALPAIGKQYLETVIQPKEIISNKQFKIIQTVGGAKEIYDARDIQVMKTIWEVITEYCGAKLLDQFIFYADDSIQVAEKIAAEIAK